jgi:hypothetical protein
VLAVILLNTVVLVWGWVDHVHEHTAELVDTGFLLVFLVELLARLRRGGWQWLRRPLNTADAIIILLALLPVVGDSVTVLRAARVAKLVHLSRHISHLRAAAWLGRRLNRPTEAAKIVARVPT